MRSSKVNDGGQVKRWVEIACMGRYWLVSNCVQVWMGVMVLRGGVCGGAIALMVKASFAFSGRWDPTSYFSATNMRYVWHQWGFAV